MSDEQTTDGPDNPTTGDRPEGGPAPLGPTEIGEDSPATDGENALSKQAERMHARRENDDS